MWRVSRAYHNATATLSSAFKSSVALLVLFLVVCMLWVVYALHTSRYPDMSAAVHSSHIPLIIIKLPRSGSSWFTDSMNSHPSVYLSKEIVQRSDTLWLKAAHAHTPSTDAAALGAGARAGGGDGREGEDLPVTPKASDLSQFTAQDIESHLISALSRPLGKLSTSASLLPSSRFVSDYITHKTFKPFRTLKVLGFTLNLEHLTETAQVDWGAITKAVPHCKVVLLLRSNLVKTAISGYTGTINRRSKGCGESNLRSSSSSIPGCNPVSLVGWDVQALSNEVTIWQERYRKLINSVEANPFLNERLVHRIYYEELQIDQQASLQTLFTKIGVNGTEAAEMASVIAHKSAQPEGNLWQKRGSDDLRQVLAQFNDIENELMHGGANCDCLVQQLRDVKPRVRSPCKAVWQPQLKRCMKLN